VTEQAILDVLTRVLRALLSDEGILLTMQTERKDIANWDSVNYVNFIAIVEMELGIKFRVADVEAFENVGQIVIAAKKMLERGTR
jgi:acyl carrier protein